MSTSRAEERQRRIVIVGAGFAGLGMAICAAPRAGSRDFVVLERASERRRHLARQHLPGLPLRRPLAPLLALVRPEPRLDALVLQRSPRSTATCATPPTRSGVDATIRFDTEMTDARWDEDARRLADRDASSGSMTRAGPADSAIGGLVEPRLPDIPGLADFEGEVFHSARWNHDYDLRRQAGRGDRHRRLGDPVRPPDPAGGRAAAPVPAHAGLDRAAQRPADQPGSSGALFRRFPALQRLAPQAIFWSREALVLGFVKHPRLMKLLQRGAARAPAPPGQGPGAAPQAHARLHDRLQAHPDLQRLLPGADPRATSTSTPRAWPRSAAARVVGTDGARARGRRDHPRHRLPGDRLPGDAGDPRPRRDQPLRALGRQPARAPLHDRRRLPQPVRDRRAQRRHRPHLGRRDVRAPVRLRARRDRDGAARGHRRRRRPARGRRSATSPRSTARWPAPSG